jgi:hypothetical protein
MRAAAEWLLRIEEAEEIRCSLRSKRRPAARQNAARFSGRRVSACGSHTEQFRSWKQFCPSGRFGLENLFKSGLQAGFIEN